MDEVQCSCGAVFQAGEDDVPVWRCPVCDDVVEPEAEGTSGTADGTVGLDDFTCRRELGWFGKGSGRQ